MIGSSMSWFRDGESLIVVVEVRTCWEVAQVGGKRGSAREVS